MELTFSLDAAKRANAPAIAARVHSQQETAQIQHRHKRANGHLAQGQFRSEYESKAFHRLKDDTVDGGKHQ